MIYNERQYKITSKQIELLSEALASSYTDEQDWLQQAQISALQSQISELEAQLVEYSLLKEGTIKFSEISDLSNFHKVLIQARISKGFSQKNLADALGMQQQQIQRYEASNYAGASLSKLIEIAGILNVTVKESWGGRNASGANEIFSWNNDLGIDWSSFPVKEMAKRGWIDLKDKFSIAEKVQNFFTSAAGSQYITAYHRKKFFGVNAPNEYSLLAWQARVLEKARDSVTSGLIKDFQLDDTWIKELVGLSVLPKSPLLAKKLLAEKGIALVIEKHLTGTYLDGAAMLLETGHPVIAITARYDRLDNFWFVLMHELGHVFLHLFNSLNMDFFDEENGTESDDIEREADRFALNNLIPDDKWKLCLSRFSMTAESVFADAKNLSLHHSIIAGRIRKERKNYTILAEMVGQGEVRSVLEEEI